MTTKPNESKSQFYTYDLGLASSLVTLDFKLTELDKTEKKVKFIFNNNEQIETIVEKYWNGYLKLSSIKLTESQKMLKNRIYNR